MKPLENGGIVNWTRNQNECIKRHETNLNFDGFPMEYAQKLSLFNIFFLSQRESCALNSLKRKKIRSTNGRIGMNQT